MTTRTIKVYRNLAEADAEWAQQTRALATKARVTVLNLIGSPGCGKTALLEETVKRLDHDCRIAVLEGDIATTKDAERLDALGIPVSQLLTDGGCHLGAQLIYQAFRELPLDELDMVVIENVGNLVCPACFDVGENAKVAFLSTTEGEEKPLKYPRLFRDAEAVVVTKIDLLPYVPFDLTECRNALRNVNDRIPVFELSSTTGDGLEPWIKWLKSTITER